MPKLTFTAHIEKLTHEGRGLAHINHKTLFVFGGLATEVVEFDYIRRKKNFDEAEVNKIISAAPQRVNPSCPHFGLCGGCSMQHAHHDLQINHKQAVLLEQLQHFGQVQAKALLPPLTGPIWSYRKKARLGVKYVAKKHTVLVGFRERKSSLLAQLDACMVLDPKVGMLITPLRELIASLTVYNQIAQIEVAVDDQRAALILRNLTKLSTEDEIKVSEFAKAHHLWIYLQPGNADTAYKLYPIDSPQALLSYALTDFNLKLEFHPLDFTQVNSEINRKLVNLAVALVDPQAHETVLDLFCGLGNFTLPLARRAAAVVGVEGAPKMVQRAQQNAVLNSITNAQFYTTDLQQDLAAAPWAQQSYDKILLDPPRTGAETIMKFLPAWKAKRIVYVSCNPATLARDANILVHQHGYTLTTVGIVDMFPHTSHVESIAQFDLSK